MDEISDELKQAATRHWNDYFSRLKPETWDECKHTIRVRSFIAGAKWRENQKPSTSDEALPIGGVVETDCVEMAILAEKHDTDKCSICSGD